MNVNAASRTCQGRAAEAVARARASGAPDVVLWSSAWERSGLVVTRRGGATVLSPGSPQWYAVLTKRIEDRLHQLTASGATVVMVTQPPYVHITKGAHASTDDEDFIRYNKLLSTIVGHSSHVHLVDLDAKVCPSGPPCPLLVDNFWLRGDGAHYTGEGSLWVARWLLPQLPIASLQKSDLALPTMTLAGLKEGQVVKGVHGIAAVAPFHLGVTSVQFVATDASSKSQVIGTGTYELGLWALYWDTTKLPNGTFTVRCIAYNASGHRSVSKGVSVKVAN